MEIQKAESVMKHVAADNAAMAWQQSIGILEVKAECVMKHVTVDNAAMGKGTWSNTNR